MGGYFRRREQRVDMATNERPTFGMHHVTVVPTNFEPPEPAVTDATEDDDE